MSIPDYFSKISTFMKMPVDNSFDQDTTPSTSPSTSIPKHNNHHFRDLSADSSDSGDEFSTTPTTPTTPMSPIVDAILNNNNTPNLQRRASESTTESIQFKKLPMTRRYTLPSRIIPTGTVPVTSESGGSPSGTSPRSPLSARFWGIGRDSSVQVAMDNFQFGL